MHGLRHSGGIVLRLFITVAPIVWLFLFIREIDLRDVEAQVRQASLQYFLLVLVVIAISTFLKALRWELTLLLTKRRSLVEVMRMLFSLVGIIVRSYAINNAFPTGVSLIYRSRNISIREGTDSSFAMGTLLLETGLDALAIVTIGVLVALRISLPTLQATILYAFVSYVVGISIIVLVLAYAVRNGSVGESASTSKVKPLRSQRFISWVVRGIEGWLGSKLSEFSLGITVFFNAPQIIIPTFILTAAIWLLEAVFFYLIVLALHLRISFGATIAVMAFTHIVVGLPAAPGYIGTLEYASITMLRRFGVASAPALAYAVVLHLFFVLPVTIAGAILLAVEDWEAITNRLGFKRRARK